MTGAVAVRSREEGATEPIDALVARLFAEPEIGQIRIHQDPRFAWVPARLPWRHAQVANLKVAIGAWVGLRTRPDELRELLVHLVDYTSHLRQTTLEEELFSIVAPVLADRPNAVEPLLARFGWDGGPPRDITDGATERRANHAQAIFLQQVAYRPIWTPILDRALAAVGSQVPLPAGLAGPLLHEACLAARPDFAAEGVLRAQEVFGKQSGLRIIEHEDKPWLVNDATGKLPRRQIAETPAGAEAAVPLVSVKDRLPQKSPNGLSVAYSEVSNSAAQASPEVRKRIREAYDLVAHVTGIIEVGALAAHLKRSGVAMPRTQLLITLNDLRPLVVLDGRWVALVGTKRESMLTKRLRQLLAVRNRLSLPVVKTQLTRAVPDYDQVPIDILRSFIDAHAEFSLDGDHLWSRAKLLAKNELDEAERFLFDLLKRGPRTRDQIDAAVKQRPRVSPARVLEALRGSVIVTVGDDGRYGLVKDGPVAAVAQPTPEPSDAAEARPPKSGPAFQKSLGQASAEARLLRQLAPQSEPEAPAAASAPSAVSAALAGAAARPADSQAALPRVKVGVTRESAATITDLLRFVREGTLVLPEIQRGYVWKRTQVRDLLDSLYRGYPIGTMLIWETEEQPIARAIGGQQSVATAGRRRNYLLDGQQRLTSLSQLMIGGEPDIRFHLTTEEFRVASAATRASGWVSVGEVFRKGGDVVLRESGQHDQADAKEHIERLEQILDRRVTLHQLIDFSYEDVTEIFVRVNSKGTRLKTAELAIAELAFRLPGLVTNELNRFVDYLAGSGWNLDPSLLLRCLTAVTSNQMAFAGLSQATEQELRNGWRQTQHAIDQFLSLLEQRLGLRSVDWLTSTTGFVIPVIYLSRVPPAESDSDGLLRWFLLANARSRYIQGSETMLNRDLGILNEHADDPFPRLIEQIRLANGGLEVHEDDLIDASQRSPFFLLSFLAMRSQQAKDWWTGEVMQATNLGPDRSLDLHHIFPKNALSRSQTARTQNELANLVFLARPAPREVTTATSVAYLWDVPSDRLRQQFVPEHTGDWRSDRFSHFLAQRRRLLVQAMNDVLAADW